MSGKKMFKIKNSMVESKKGVEKSENERLKAKKKNTMTVVE